MVLGHGRKGLLGHLEGGEHGGRGGADQGAGHAVDGHVPGRGQPAPAGDLGGAGREHALPDVLADQHAEAVDHELGDDRLEPHGPGEEVGGVQALGDPGPATPGREGEGQQDREDPDGHEHELHEVRERDGPHPAEHRVGDHHHAAQQDGPRPGDGEQHGEDRGVGRGGGHGDHHGVREHHERRRRGATARAVAQLQHLGDREHLQRLDARREEEAQHCEPGGDGHHEPHPGDPVLVAQPHTAHGGGTAQHHGSHGGGVEARTQTTPGHAVVRGGARTACGPQPDHHHRGQVQHDHEHVHGGSPRAGGRVPRVLIRLRFRAGAWR